MTAISEPWELRGYGTDHASIAVSLIAKDIHLASQQLISHQTLSLRCLPYQNLARFKALPSHL